MSITGQIADMWYSSWNSEHDCLRMVLPRQPTKLGCLWPWDSQGISRQASAAHIHQLDSEVHKGRTAKSKHSMKKRKTVFHLKNVFKQKNLTYYVLFLCLQDCVKKKQSEQHYTRGVGWTSCTCLLLSWVMFYTINLTDVAMQPIKVVHKRLTFRRCHRPLLIQYLCLI